MTIDRFSPWTICEIIWLTDDSVFRFINLGFYSRGVLEWAVKLYVSYWDMSFYKLINFQKLFRSLPVFSLSPRCSHIWWKGNRDQGDYFYLHNLKIWCPTLLTLTHMNLLEKLCVSAKMQEIFLNSSVVWIKYNKSKDLK